MPLLKNARHEEFCQQVVKGKSLVDAYESAGYVRHDGNSSALAARAEVAARIAEIRGEGANLAAAKVAFTVETALMEYEEARALAKAIEQPATMVSATSGKVKVTGIQPPDKVTIDGKIEEVNGARDEFLGRVTGLKSRLLAHEGTGKPH